MDGKSPIDLSITIASFNTLDFTRQCLRSVFDNTLQISFEVIVVDNDSHDGSPEMIRSEFPDVHLVCNDKNVGVAAATNQGIALSRGRYFITMNSDTIVQSNALDKLVKFMDQHPQVGAVTPKLEVPDGSPHTDYCGNVISFKALLLDTIAPLKADIREKVWKARGHGTDYTKTQEVPCIIMGTAMMVRREVLDSVGPQDPRFFVYGEDIDWATRIVKAGWKSYIVADALVLHYGGRSTSQTSVKMTAQLFRSRCRYVQKHYGLLAGWTIRLAAASISSIRLVKWLVIYLVKPSARSKADPRIDEMSKIIGAVLHY